MNKGRTIPPMQSEAPPDAVGEIRNLRPKRLKSYRNSGSDGDGKDKRLRPGTLEAHPRQQQGDVAPPLPGPRPIALLPGEKALDVETNFGEGRLRLQGTSAAPEVQGGGASVPEPHECVPPQWRYDEAVRQARAGMSARAKALKGPEIDVARVCAAFERCCLAGGAATPEERLTVVREYDAALRRCYPHFMHSPFVLSASTLDTFEGQEELQLLRCTERRFIIWLQDQDGAQPSGEQSDEQGEGGGAWGDGLAAIWRSFTDQVQGKTCGDVDMSQTDDTVSCAVHDSVWCNGRLARRPAPAGASVLRCVESSLTGGRNGRLYITDASMPDYQGRGYPLQAPGMPCAVDAAANAMLPHAVQSCRGSSLMHLLKIESTGTATFTMFVPCGGGVNLTAFHFETKRRRSYNLGSGDYIIQPVATVDNMRLLMRVHAAVIGAHTRHGQLLPLEVYLEAEVDLVAYPRDGPAPSLCELCEQSMHAFVSFGDVGCRPPTLKVSCNDFDLAWELESAYFLESLSLAYKEAGVIPEEAPPPDQADTWVQSAYLTREPRTQAAKEALQEGASATSRPSSRSSSRHSSTSGRGKASHRGATLVRPWLCEQAGADLAAGPQWMSDGDLDCGMEVLAVRGVEKVLDVAGGRLQAGNTAPWAGELPREEDCLRCLRSGVLVLADMLPRSASELAGSNGTAKAVTSRGINISPGSSQYDSALSECDRTGTSSPPLGATSVRAQCHFSSEYLKALLAEVAPFLGAADAAELLLWAEAQLSGSGKATGKGPLHQQQEHPLHRLRMQAFAALRAERDALERRPIDWVAVVAARAEREAVDREMDGACVQLVRANGAQWGVCSSGPGV